MEQPAICRLCGASNSCRLIESITKPVTDLYHCTSCDAQFWWPVKNPGADWYEQTYSGRNDNPAQHLGWNHYQFLNEPIEPGTLLDVGCDIGHLMAEARGRGWQVWGLDFDEDAVKAAAEQYNITTVATQSMEQFSAANPGRQFKVVTAFEVLEHMDDPRSFIGDILSLTQPGGHIAISVPYRNAPIWIRPHDYPPRHLTRWNRTAIMNFLNGSGLEVVHARRGAVTLERLLMRFKFAAGRFGSLGMVKQARSKLGSAAPTVAGSLKLQCLRRAARLKDWVLFGLPAIGYWVYLWARRRHYNALYVLARRKP